MGYTNAELMEMVHELELQLDQKNAEIVALTEKVHQLSKRSRP